VIASYDKQFLFLHNPRTGGTSIATALRPYGHDASSQPVNRILALVGVRVNHWLGDYRDRRFRVHSSALTIQNRIPRDIFHRCFKFAFVRNPWDLFVSYHRYVMSRPHHKRHRRFAKMDFADYLRFLVDRHVGFQSEFLSNERGELLVDFVGRFERLRQDFAQVTQCVGINAQLPHLNATTSTDYREYYTPHTRNFVLDSYRHDIERFEYCFDSANTDTLALPLESCGPHEV
jgi:hypothetical protein